MKTLSDKIIQPLLSEKISSREARFNEYAVLVDGSMSKPEISAAILKIFGVKPLAVRTLNFRKKTRQTRYGAIPSRIYKKALVRLPEGKRLEMK